LKKSSSIRFILLALLIASALGATLIQEGHALNVINHTMCKDIDQDGLPVNQTSTFLTIDERACSWIEVEDVTVATTITWLWITPDGTTYSERTIDLSPGYSWYCWSSIEINNTPAAEKPGNWKVEVYYDNTRLFTEKFTLTPPTYTITFNTDPQIASITIDGKKYYREELPKSFTWKNGTTHIVSVNETIPSSTGTRYIFIKWSDGLSDKSRRIIVTKPANYTAEYKIQYELAVYSPYSEVQGTGWYDENSAVTLSIKETSVSESGILGILGVKHVFERWSGNSTATTANTTIKMNKPKTVKAVWKTDYTQLYINLGFIVTIIAVASIGGLIIKKRKKTPPPSVPTCPTCGQPLAYIQQYNRWYCSKCKKYV